MTVQQVGERERYDAWWQSGPGRPCTICTRGDSEHATALQAQGPSFYPMHNFGPDRTDVPVRYLLVGMEPSEHGFDVRLRRGAKPEDARNFGGSSRKSLDSVLQFATRRWLCDANETFLLTDIAKCAVRDARKEPPTRQAYRWSNCAPYLTQEATLFDLRAVIGVGGLVRKELRRRSSLESHRLFGVLHFAARAANQQRVLTSETERNIDNEVTDSYQSFLDERRAALGKLPEPRRKVSGTTKTLLAAYRKQFGCIKRALANASFECGQRKHGTCCHAVPRLPTEGGI